LTGLKKGLSLYLTRKPAVRVDNLKRLQAFERRAGLRARGRRVTVPGFGGQKHVGLAFLLESPPGRRGWPERIFKIGGAKGKSVKAPPCLDRPRKGVLYHF